VLKKRQEASFSPMPAIDVDTATTAITKPRTHRKEESTGRSEVRQQHHTRTKGRAERLTSAMWAPLDHIPGARAEVEEGLAPGVQQSRLGGHD
jgi:hypothetical protein